jgi:drug/metabolite transporter (DMT)-like permease
MFLASASFATMSAFIKGLGQELPLPELVFLRCLLAIPVLMLFVKFKQRPFLVKARKLIILRTLFGMSAMFCFFYALTHMPLAECIFLGRTQPLILALFAPFVIGEKAPAAAWVAICTGIGGVALIMLPGVSWSFTGWIAISGAAFAAMAHLMVRRLNATDFPLSIVFNFTVLTCLISGVWVLPRFVMPDFIEWILLLCVALFASLGQLFMTLAYQHDRAPAVASASYASVLLAVIYGMVIWKEIPQQYTWIGGGLIIFGGLILLKSRLHVTEPPSPAST